MDITTLEHQVLHLPASDRARLAHKLLLSLDGLTEAETSEAWIDEAERRARQIDQGLVELVPAEEVMAKARSLLR